MGLEPANSSVYGKPYHIEENSLHKMEPFAVEHKKIILTFIIYSKPDPQFLIQHCGKCISLRICHPAG